MLYDGCLIRLYAGTCSECCSILEVPIRKVPLVDLVSLENNKVYRSEKKVYYL